MAETGAFDVDYYLDKYIPLAQDACIKYGLTKSSVKLGPETGCALQMIMFRENPQSLGKAMKEAGAEVMGDLKNFSTEIAAGNMD
ncbi:hypothetical protein NM208_g374 [Fusarium decemcellulare]|uniref:Uncharacterized protein n=1 Tax=Fusarium decemcellulare TaxID=57161 RepID=A0ACC1T012_9HYPO|nr:hypothetical protein NM208_g374 [Fusarium decemcellulare]